MTCAASVTWDQAYLAYDFGDHPLNPLRLEFTSPLGFPSGWVSTPAIVEDPRD